LIGEEAFDVPATVPVASVGKDLPGAFETAQTFGPRLRIAVEQVAEIREGFSFSLRELPGTGALDGVAEGRAGAVEIRGGTELTIVSDAQPRDGGIVELAEVFENPGDVIKAGGGGMELAVAA